MVQEEYTYTFMEKDWRRTHIYGVITMMKPIIIRQTER